MAIVLLVGKARLLLPGPVAFGQPRKHVEIHPKPHLCIYPSSMCSQPNQNVCQHHSWCVGHGVQLNANLQNRSFLWRQVVHEVLRLHSWRVLEKQKKKKKRWLVFIASCWALSLKRQSKGNWVDGARNECHKQPGRGGLREFWGVHTCMERKTNPTTKRIHLLRVCDAG